MTDKEIGDKTRQVLYENMIKGHLDGGKTTFHYTKPSPGTYPFQFFWDTCFHVFILTALGEHNMAKEHLYSLFAMQKEDGFVGHMIYWDRLKPGRFADFFQSKPSFKHLFKSHMSALIQPPLVAQAVARVYEVTGDKAFLSEMLPKLKKYYRWLARNRDFQGDGLLTIISPFESGMDWKPTFDVVVNFQEKKADWRLFIKMAGVDFRNFLNNYNLKKVYKKGYFLVKEVGLNTIYAQNLNAMAGLCKELGEEKEAGAFKRLGEQVSRSILEVMYDKKDAAFYDVYGKENTKIKILTPTIFYPVVLKSLPKEVKEKVITKHFFNSEEFDTPFPIPSVAKNHPSFDPTASMYIWRGPTWILNNWFMHQFLMENGYEKESNRLIDSIRNLIEKSGFREYYNPFTGEGYGAKDFTWAGLVLDMIQMEKKRTAEASYQS
ncbi:amylo-alpha-1,6-glucosidase [Nafulsella turpanensis]|uniref:amylo-alpha-1,6-glucosidase n=1 Tax=Nafulsella turpanensis TaxID=1265690 RepID=UPI0003465C8D|nr:trehalase family glycosidase [Nafulsella turpanensis]